MSGNLSDFGLSGKRVLSLPCGWQGPFSTIAMSSPRVVTASGPVTATVRKTIFSVSGAAGRLDALMVQSTNSTSKTMTMRIVRDGVEIFLTATATVATTNSFVALGDVVSGTTSSVLSDPIEWDNSILIEYTSSVTETDGANISYKYRLEG